MKLDLKKDQQTLLRYVKQRIRDYPVYENLGPGNDDDPIALLTLGYYASQGGYVNLVLDTRPNAEIDGEWTVYIDNDMNTCPFPHWYDACMTLLEDNHVTVKTHDGNTSKVKDELELQNIFGNMLVELLIELQDDGTLKKLPLTDGAYMVVEEFDGCFFWPEDDPETNGRI